MNKRKRLAELFKLFQSKEKRHRDKCNALPNRVYCRHLRIQLRKQKQGKQTDR